MSGPKFVQRVARLPQVLAVLARHPDGLTVAALAAHFDVSVEVMHEDLTVYADVGSWGWAFDVFRRAVLEFDSPEGDADGSDEDVEDRGAAVVRLSTPEDFGLGVEHISAGDLALVYAAGSALRETDPNDEHLASALDLIAETMYADPEAPASAGSGLEVQQLQNAAKRGRRVRIVYSRAWRQGVTERTIEPYRLVQTHRGWEVDAGPVDSDGNLRTFLVSNIREVETLDEHFEAPKNLESLLSRQRATTTVRMTLTQDARWAAHLYAESVTVVSEDDDGLEADLELLPPAGQRAGLLMLASGPDTRVLHPGALVGPATDVVEDLLQHHQAEVRG